MFYEKNAIRSTDLYLHIVFLLFDVCHTVFLVNVINAKCAYTDLLLLTVYNKHFIHVLLWYLGPLYCKQSPAQLETMIIQGGYRYTLRTGTSQQQHDDQHQYTLVIVMLHCCCCTVGNV